MRPPSPALLLVLVLVLVPVLGCEKPRDRACRSLLLQARNADAARTTATPDARIAVHRARSAARWLRSNAVEDRELATQAHALADALDRFADAGLRLATASEVLGATDATDLLARAEHVSAYVGSSDRVHAIGIEPCPWNVGDSLIEDPRCTPYDSRAVCPPFDTQLTLSQHADECLRVAETLPELARVPADAVELVTAMRAHAAFIKTLPVHSAKETVDGARSIAKTFEDRGRADADVTTGIRAIEAKCAP